jgi:hypothetical protein
MCFASPSLSTTTAERNYIANDWTFYNQGNYENNCLAYALGNTTSWIWPWGSSNPTLQEVFNYLLSSYGYTSYRSYSSQPYPHSCTIACYGTLGNVTHFSKIISGGLWWNSGTCRAKWGRCEIFSHSTLDPYTDNVYGSLIAMFRKL